MGRKLIDRHNLVEIGLNRHAVIILSDKQNDRDAVLGKTFNSMWSHLEFAKKKTVAEVAYYVALLCR